MSIQSVLADVEEVSQVISALSQDTALADRLLSWSQACARCIETGGAIYFAGNGGSFSDAQHLAAELTGKMGRKRPPFAGIALGSNGCSMTAIGNDFDFEDVFAREFTGLARSRSVVIALSTSGNSRNIVRLVDTAASQGATVFGLTGGSGGLLAERCETIIVPSDRTERIQEAHIVLGHILCRLIEDDLHASGLFDWE